MKDKNQIIKTTLAGVMAISTTMLASSVYAVPDNPKQWEKCAGVAKTGMNDCGALDGKHSCAGQAKMQIMNGYMFLREPLQKLLVAL